MPWWCLGAEVPPERSDGHREQDRETDEDVAGVEAREAEERGREGRVARVEADAVVLDHLREQEGRAEQEREHHPGAEARAIALLDRLSSPSAS